MNICIKLLLLILLSWPVAALAGLAEEVVADFAVREGYVVMPINDEYLVDLDARDNLQIGDILTLVKPGPKILHPVTNEVLGSVDETVGFLQVTRIHSGYSYVKPLTAGITPGNGAPVKRFEQVPALLLAENPDDQELARQIKASLPQLQWLEGDKAEQALLTFALQGDALQVSNAQGDPLRRYNISADRQMVSSAKPAARPYVTPQVGPQVGPLQKIVTTMLGNVAQSNEKRFAEMDAAILRQEQFARQGIWMGPNLAGHPSALAVGDLDGDGLQETAVVLDKTLLIARIVSGEFTQVAEIPIPGSLQVLSIDAIDLDNNGRAELYLSALKEHQPASFVVEFAADSYRIVISNLNWLLRAVEIPDHSGRALVGQRLGNREIVFAGDVFRVSRSGTILVEGDPLDLPSGMNIFNFVPFPDNLGGLNFAHLTGGDYLKVFAGTGKELWESAGYYGGSENCFTIRPEFKDELLTPYCMKPRMLTRSGNEILIVQNDGQRMIQRYRKFKSSRIVSLTWNGFAMIEGWQTATQPGYLSDYALADADNDGKEELVMAITFKHDGLASDARSAIVTYELD